MSESQTTPNPNEALLPNDPTVLDKLMKKSAEQLTDDECDLIVMEIRRHRKQLEVKKKAKAKKKTYKDSAEGAKLTLDDLDLGDIV